MTKAKKKRKSKKKDDPVQAVRETKLADDCLSIGPGAQSEVPFSFVLANGVANMVEMSPIDEKTLRVTVFGESHDFQVPAQGYKDSLGLIKGILSAINVKAQKYDMLVRFVNDVH